VMRNVRRGDLTSRTRIDHPQPRSRDAAQGSISPLSVPRNGKVRWARWCSPTSGRRAVAGICCRSTRNIPRCSVYLLRGCSRAARGAGPTAIVRDAAGRGAQSGGRTRASGRTCRSGDRRRASAAKAGSGRPCSMRRGHPLDARHHRAESSRNRSPRRSRSMRSFAVCAQGRRPGTDLANRARCCRPWSTGPPAEDVGFSQLISLGRYGGCRCRRLPELPRCGPRHQGDPDVPGYALPDPRKFMSAARAAARVEPVIAVKPAPRRVGTQLQRRPRTGALASAGQCGGCGAAARWCPSRVDDLEDLFYAAEITARFPAAQARPAGDRRAMVVVPGVLAVEPAARRGRGTRALAASSHHRGAR